MAHLKAVNFQDYYASRLYGRPDKHLNQFLVRYSQPIGKLLLRATMPVVVSAPPEQEPMTGLGDFNLFAIYNFYSKNGTKFGLGPNITIPTGTHDLGQGKWQAGIGKVIPIGKCVFNIFAEPQLSVAAEGAGQPAYQTFFGFNTQF